MAFKARHIPQKPHILLTEVWVGIIPRHIAHSHGGGRLHCIIHDLTKYIHNSAHSDSATTKNVYEKMRLSQKVKGNTPSVALVLETPLHRSPT
jgi:hypothetical protein